MNDCNIYCSLSKLTELRRLYLSGNDFSAGLPEVISEMRSLCLLGLEKCNLTDLPCR